MRFCYIPAFSVATSVLSTAPRVISKRISACKVTSFLVFSLCFLLLCGAVVSYGSDVKLVSSDVSGVTLEVQLDDLTIRSKEFDGKNYHLVSYDDCAFTSDVGKPRVPISHAFIGVPPTASISVNVVDSQYSDFPGYVLSPVPEQIQNTSPDGVDTLIDKFVEDKSFYRRNTLYPSENVALVNEGYIRRQRIAVIELRPVQYNPMTRLLRKYSRLVVRVSFSSGSNARMSGSMLTGNTYLQNDREFEKLYQGLLLNYDDARKLRKARSTTAMAPRAETSEALKIFVRQQGIYRLDHEMLLGAGMNLSEVDPLTIKVRLRGNQIPLYIKGEADGSFDEGDYIEFFGARANNIYTRWDVYWLTWGGVRGMRMAQTKGGADTPMAREVTSFNSVTRFDEDHLHHKLQNVYPDPKAPDAWFESRDHWFWAGIENGSAKNEVTVEFPVYDLAQSLARPSFEIEMVGCTNFEHNIMISINGYKVGEEAQWDRQDIYSFDGQVSANALREGVNELRLTRIGSDSADGSNTDNYPYQVYLNWFKMGYIRKLLAVNDSLIFSAPEPKDSSGNEINRYTIGGFMSDDVEIFQITDSNAVRIFKNVATQRYELDQQGLDRIRKIRSILGESTVFDVRDFAYRAVFEERGGNSSRYMAVTSASVLTPERIELDIPSNLKDPSNQADYIIISHPTFMDVANELADWRAGAKGGGFRTQVIDVTDVYDEFGLGMADPEAVKDFLRFAYNNWSEPAPAYVLIFGDATYDFLGINEEFYPQPPELTAFIPTFYIHTSFGQTAVDHQYSTIEGDDGFPDIHLGRIPVENIQEAESVVRKIIANETGDVNGPWRKQIISIADDDTHAAGDEQFRIGLEDIWQNYTPVGYDTTRIYLKDISQQVEQDPLEDRRPAKIVKEMIMNAFANGSVIAQYSGHGGRHVWAHEIIFSIVDIEDTSELETYPFMLVLSCYNGYFDLPGELSMAEGLLRADRRGIVAMLSATRLTYGSGNISLNELLFEGIFEDKILRIGPVISISKTRLLIKDGLTWLNQMQEYTLFGDPASRLNIPDYEIYPQLDNATLAPGGKLKVSAGQIVKSTGGQPGNFSGQLTVTALFPDGGEISETITAKNGSYPGVSFDVPAGTMGGQGRLKFYGENVTEVVNGGTKFSVSEPSILSVNHELTGEKLQLYARVNDDAGISGIESVTLIWWDNWVKNTSPMVFDKQRDTYRLEEAISLSFQNENFNYYLTAVDVEGNSISTEQETIKLPSKPDLIVLLTADGSEPSISYGYSAQFQQPSINVRVQNSRSAEITHPVNIYAFTGHPDQDSDGKVDADDTLRLGKGRIKPEDWNDEGIASAVMELDTPPLSPGRHIVFVWVDPEINGSDDISGQCDEVNEGNNISYKILNVAQVVLGTSGEKGTQSFDGVMDFNAPAGAVDKSSAIVIQPVQSILQPFNQSAVSFVLFPENQYGYNVFPLYDSSDQESKIENLEFNKPVSLQLKFDLAAFADDVKNEIGMGDIPANQMTPDQIQILNEILKERVSDIAIHRWHEAPRKWAHIPSTPVLDDSGETMRSAHSTIPIHQNVGTGRLRTSNIQPDDNATPAGEWVVFFIDLDRYQLYFRDTGQNSILQKLSEKTGRVGQLYVDDEATGGGSGIQITVEGDDIPFQFGDVFRFVTTESFGQDGSRELEVDDVNQGKDSDLVVRNISIDEGSKTPMDEWVILFLDPQHFHIQGSKTGVIKRNNEPYIGTVGEEFHDQTTGFRFTIMPGARDPRTGHKFKFKTVETGTIQATSETTGIFSLMLNTDERPPDIQMDIADQNFYDGDVVSSEPTIHALISDDNGVDVLTHGLGISIGMDGGDFEPAGEDDYVLHWDAASNSIPVNYWPGKLAPGEYEVRLQAYDFNGNSSDSSITFVVKGDFKLATRSLMNYPNPFDNETDITFRLSSLADEVIIKIYTVSGRLIKTLEDSHVVNFVVVHWDGRDEDGKEVANGVYYYKVKLKSEGKKEISEIGKMLKLK